LEIRVNENFINKIYSLPIAIPWDKEEIQEATNAKKLFFHPNERPQEDKNGTKRESLLYPCPEVAYQIIKYINYEGRMSIVYSYHFRLLHQLRHCYN
jgi:hypothetical protein